MARGYRPGSSPVGELSQLIDLTTAEQLTGLVHVFLCRNEFVSALSHLAPAHASVIFTLSAYLARAPHVEILAAPQGVAERKHREDGRKTAKKELCAGILENSAGQRHCRCLQCAIVSPCNHNLKGA